MRSTENTYDVIIIGSGMGALACASLLAQLQHKRVLVLERHFKIGGFTHTFVRKGKYEWDIGLHYIGEMHPRSMSRAIFDYVTGGGVKWEPMPQAYDRFVYPDFTFDACARHKTFKRDLIERFPHERDAIEQYFVDVASVGGWLMRYFMNQSMPRMLNKVTQPLKRPGAKLALMTTGEYLNTHFKDPHLKAVLVSQWGDIGLPPSMSAFAIHAAIVSHYRNGGWYPVGGGKSIADSIMPIVESYGGVFKVNHRVDEIIIRNGKAIGVRATHVKGKSEIEHEFYAETIISNAGAYNTYMRLIPETVDIPFRDEVADFPGGISSVTLYVGSETDPAELGFNGQNHWLFDSYDHDDIYARRNDIVNGHVGACLLSFPSMKNPEARGHTMEIITLVDWEPFKKWAGQAWLRRDAEYQAVKDQISNALVERVGRYCPQFMEIVDYKELSTPLSSEHFTGHRKGDIYGIAAIPDRFRAKWIGTHTPIRHLYMAGSDSGVHGVVGALLSGAATASAIMGLRGNLGRIIMKARRFQAENQ